MAASAPPFREAQTGILIRLRGVYPSLKTALKKVGDAILNQPEMAVYASVNEVAAQAGVSEATVMRFCRTLGFKGFQDFKITLAREMASPSPGLGGEVKEEGHAPALVREIFQAHIAALHDNLRVLDLDAMAQAAQTLLQAPRAWFVGVGASGPIAAYAHSRFLRLGLPVSWCPDPHLVKMVASLLTPGDAMVAISHSGITPEPLEIARLARQAGARVICITNNSLSPLSREADLLLVTASRETDQAQETTASRLSELAIIDGLFALVAAARPEQTKNTWAKIDQVIFRKN